MSQREEDSHVHICALFHGDGSLPLTRQGKKQWMTAAASWVTRQVGGRSRASRRFLFYPTSKAPVTSFTRARQRHDSHLQRALLSDTQRWGRCFSESTQTQICHRRYSEVFRWELRMTDRCQSSLQWLTQGLMRTKMFMAFHECWCHASNIATREHVNVMYRSGELDAEEAEETVHSYQKYSWTDETSDLIRNSD